VHHKEAIVSATSNFNIDNIEVYNASVSVNYSGAGGSTGVVTNSRFVDVSIAGILVYGTDNAFITDNEFARCVLAIAPQVPGGVSGVTVERNFVYGWDYGIVFRGGSGSTIQNNLVRHNTWRGIFMGVNDTCPETPTPGCFYATGNTITGNTATNNFIDLGHHPNATGNTWTDNTCQTKEGAEIPPCTGP
jgi:parallel beta-helix repeat protein